MEPVWVPRVVVEATHFDQLHEHGGSHGLRDENALEAALARPRNKFHYDEVTDLATLASAYAFAIAKSHPFTDGNKRTAFVTAAIFLELNGYELHFPDDDVIATILSLAAGELGESALADWLRSGMRSTP